CRGGWTTRSSTSRAAALAIGVAAAVLAAALPKRAAFGPEFTATRDRVAALPDAGLRAAGSDPARWTRTATVRDASVDGALRRFLRDSLGESARAAAVLQALATSYAPGPVWEVRYVRRSPVIAERAESGLQLVRADGAVRQVMHEVPDAAPGDTLTADRARAATAAALRARGV
ncbi:hypothetical protein PYV61_26545, partial [Roseisolibacter sp. H3M3-2]